LAIFWMGCASSFGQELSPELIDFGSELILPRGAMACSWRSFPDLSASNRWGQCPLFRMPVGLSTDVLSVDDGDSDNLAVPALMEDRRWQFALGSDNQYFDFRRPGDWGGIGFYRLESQYLLLDNSASCLGLGFHAVTPAGLDAGGIEHGPTVICPHLAWFYQLGGGTGFQGFVSKSVHANSEWRDGPGRSIRYGLALQRPFPGLESDPNPRAQLFLEALGRNRFDGTPDQSSSSNFEFVPGVHWRATDTSWVSSGVLMPLDGFSPARLLWQVTCSWRY
jgi:hypothetical protein